eukprot:PhM_4_TR8008/c0_g2_i1/m.97603
MRRNRTPTPTLMDPMAMHTPYRSDISPEELAKQWLESNERKRHEIARTYPTYFMDAAFLALLRAGLVEAKEMPESYSSLHNVTRIGHDYNNINNNTFDRLIQIGVEVVNQPAQCAEVVALYSTQFDHPDVGTFRRMVKVTTTRSTRTRTVHIGPFSWLLRNVTDNELIGCISGHVHRSVACNLCFMEVSFFCTNKKYVGRGFARLLNALVQRHAEEIGCTFVLVSASLTAVAFWSKPSMGYCMITPDVSARVDLYMKEACVQFQNTELLVWHVGSENTAVNVSLALQKIRENIQLIPR